MYHDSVMFDIDLFLDFSLCEPSPQASDEDGSINRLSEPLPDIGPHWSIGPGVESTDSSLNLQPAEYQQSYSTQATTPGPPLASPDDTIWVYKLLNSSEYVLFKLLTVACKIV